MQIANQIKTLNRGFTVSTLYSKPLKMLIRFKTLSNFSVLRRFYCANPKPSGNTVEVNGFLFSSDDYTNVTPKIQSFLGRNLHVQKDHPLSILRQRIVDYFYTAYRTNRGNPVFSVYDSLSPVVTVEQNFDNLLIAADHPSRAKSDCYYINRNYLLRAHTTAHQADLIRSGLDNFLVCGEVYRRDEIDATHYPVFHQLDGVRTLHRDKLFSKKNNEHLEIFETSFKERLNGQPDPHCIDQMKQPCHTLESVKLMEHELKTTLLELAKSLFGAQIEYRWVDTTFPFTQPSWELEIMYSGKWLEVLGCGIMRDEILKKAGVSNSIGYAFGLGLERLAMILFDIPDIRLFWSRDTGFLNQFSESSAKIQKYKPVSLYPQCANDLSFWLSQEMANAGQYSMNDFYDVIRDVGGDTIEQVTLKDEFKHPKTGKTSLCFRIVYRHMEKTLTQAEVNELHSQVAQALVKQYGVVIR